MNEEEISIWVRLKNPSATTTSCTSGTTLTTAKRNRKRTVM